MKPKTVIIVQARMGSTRLPGKILKTVLDRPLLSYQIERLRRVTLADQLLIATTLQAADQVIVRLCQQEGVDTFRGSEEDVLNRYYLAAREAKATTVVRVTSDCPLIEPAVIDRAIATLLENSDKFDYVSNGLERTYPRGMDVEAFTFEALERAEREAKEASEREHVTLYMVRHPELFRLASIKAESDNSRYRLTVDTPEDFELIKRLLEALYPHFPNFTLDQLLQLLKENPEWPKINANIKQKAV
jgi:spore coat polysaccharide biosynthesis protein SpsF